MPHVSVYRIPKTARLRLPSLQIGWFDSSGSLATDGYSEKGALYHKNPSPRLSMRKHRYWQGVGGHTFLPGTHRAADRFARLSYNLDAVPKAPHS